MRQGMRQIDPARLSHVRQINPAQLSHCGTVVSLKPAAAMTAIIDVALVRGRMRVRAARYNHVAE